MANEKVMAGFKRLNKARFAFTCAKCGDRFPSGNPAYWRRQSISPGESKTITICQQCFKTA